MRINKSHNDRTIEHTLTVFTVVPLILILSNFFMYQLMHNSVAVKEY
jgi:hypothetical protein